MATRPNQRILHRSTSSGDDAGPMGYNVIGIHSPPPKMSILPIVGSVSGSPRSSPTSGRRILNLYHHQFSSQFMWGLTVAGVASSLLATTFGMFHVDVFLRVYELPLETYSMGNLVFALVNTTNDVLIAWFLDSITTGSIHRSDLIGLSGCGFAICFLTPFFRWQNPSSWDGLHFVVSMSLYDTMYSFTTILLGSLITDNHHMTDKERVRFMASGKFANLLAAFAVARTGLAVFDEEDMSSFRPFLWMLTLLVMFLFVLAHFMTRYVVMDWRRLKFRLVKTHEALSLDRGKRSARKLKIRQVIRDFLGHRNFWAWIGMELFLESQNKFADAFLKTFVDRLVFDRGVDRETCDWLLSFIRPLGLIAGVFCYIPIQQVGYRRVYPILFATNIALSVFMLFVADHRSTNYVIFFLIVYPTITLAVGSSGFHLAMSDMVLEMKKIHAKDGRSDEPSLAAMYMGVNALFCKPAESILPVFAANMLSHLNLHVEGNEDVQRALYKVLILPPLAFSIFQWLSWRRYTLTPQQTSQMREDLKSLNRDF